MQATLRFLTKKGVIDRYHEIRQPQPLEEADKVNFMLNSLDGENNFCHKHYVLTYFGSQCFALALVLYFYCVSFNTVVLCSITYYFLPPVT